METCRVSVLLANIATVYIFASVYYILSTRHLGTPFKNEIKKYPKIMKIKHKAVCDRRKAFFTGILLSLIFVVIVKPFQNCTN